MIKTVEKKIGDYKFEITTFGAVSGVKMASKIIKLILPIFHLAGRTKSLSSLLDTELSQINPESIDKIIGYLEVRLNDELIDLILELVSNTLLNGKQIDRNIFDTYFSGEYDILVKLIIEVIKVNNFLPLGSIGEAQK